MSGAGVVQRRRGYVVGDGLSGGFWRRVVAFVLDNVVVSVVLSLIAAFAFSISNGAVRHSSPIMSHLVCSDVDPAESANIDRLMRPPSQGPTLILRPDRPPDRAGLRRCDKSPSHSVALAQFVWEGSPTYSETVGYPLRPSGQLADRTLDLAHLFFPVLLIWLAFSEAAWGCGPGKRLMGLRVLHRDGIRRASFGATLTRNALLYGPSAALGLGLTIHGQIDTTRGGPLYDPVFGWVIVVLGGLSIIWSLLLHGIVLVQRPDPFWDRWSGVSVRRRVWIDER
ncbi:RDD family protein [Brevundimonas sp.]|jgi:uncharacterized RDD family membrane protein YckC|uniref:RDD family protein n=1 Tax=Brevundimonas sp. TaxID=1871086 RepID=UPI0039191783